VGRSGLGSGVAAVLTCLELSGCTSEPGPLAPSSKAAGETPSAAVSVTIPDPVWTVMQRNCAWCHTPAHPLAGIDLSQRTQTLGQVLQIGRGVQVEAAPLIARLADPDKRAILSWVQQVAGPLPAVRIPTSVHWELAPLLAGLRDGAPVPGFGFVVEDGFIDTVGWKVATYTDRFGITFRSVSLDQTHGVDAAIFHQSHNPSTYFVFKNIPWHGRFHDARLEGDVRVDRWISVGMQAEGIEPTGRSHRRYVRLQFDRDSICLRSAPTSLETWPWGVSGAAAGPDGRLQGKLNASGFYQSSSEWLHFVLTARRIAGGVKWNALVTRRGTGATVASLQAFEAQAAPRSGTFFLHAYAVGKKRNWANLVYDACIDGAGAGGVLVPVPPPGIHPGGDGQLSPR